MNFFNKALHKLVLSPQALYKRLGIQTDKLSLILQVKLMMDDRRPASFNQQQRHNKPKKEYNKSTVWTILGSVFIGLLLLNAFSFGDERLLQLTLYFSMYIVFLAMILITEVSTLLLDSKDNTIILPAPVNARTLLLGRLLHIVIITMRTGLPMMLAGWVVTGIIDGWKAALLFPWVCILAILFAVFLVNSFYLIILRFLSVQRFKNIITTMQIVLSIVVFAGYQLLPRIIGNINLNNFSFQSVSWSIYFPTQWFAALYTLIIDSNFSTWVVAGASAAVVVPLVAFYILIKYLAPAFNRKIGMLTGGETVKPLTLKQKAVQQRGGSLANNLSLKFARNYTEQAAFRLAWNISSRSRDFKMKVYPSIGYQLVYLLIFFVGKGNKLSLDGFNEMNPTSFTLMMMLVYLSAFSINTIITQMQMSEKPKAAWVFFVTPLTEPGRVISGAYKAMLVKFLLPTFAVISIITLVLTHGKIAPHLIIGFANVLMCCTIFGVLFLKKFPFSTPVQDNGRSGNIILSIVVSLLPIIIGLLHAYFKNNLLVLLSIAAVSLVITFQSFRQMQKHEWQKILSKYED
jgi:ABC-2 type transport system permease protein